MLTLEDPFVLLPRPLLVNTSLTGRTLPFLRRGKIIAGRRGAELVLRVHDSERTSDTFGAESMRANIFTAASSPFSERTREILLVFPENEATAAAAFAVQHLLGKSLDSRLGGGSGHALRGLEAFQLLPARGS